MSRPSKPVRKSSPAPGRPRPGSASSAFRARALAVLKHSRITSYALAWKFPGEGVSVSSSGAGRAHAGSLRKFAGGAHSRAVRSAPGILSLCGPRDPWIGLLALPAARAGAARAAVRRELVRAARAVWESARASHTLQAWARALDGLDEGIVMTDLSGVIVEAGDSAGRILGVRSSDLPGKALDDWLGQDTCFPWPPRGPLVVRDTGVTHSTGASLALSVKIHRSPGAPVCMAVLTDLTSERRAQEQARRRDRLAALGELSAGVAHEIRNPLAGINTSAQVLRNRLDPGDERRRFLDVIQEEVARLDRIVSGLLDYARPWTLSLKRVSVPECTRKVLGLVQDSAERQGVTLEVHCPDDLPEVFADQDQLTQVLLNIFRNALEAMPRGGRLRIEARRAQRMPFTRRSGGRRTGDPVLPQTVPVQPQPVVQLRISDTGEGIQPENLPRLFDPFFTTKATGTGLGLAICQTIIHEHGGSIAAESSPGRGTQILIDLPLEKRHGQRRKDG